MNKSETIEIKKNLQTTVGHNRVPPRKTYYLFRINIAHEKNWKILNKKTKTVNYKKKEKPQKKWNNFNNK